MLQKESKKKHELDFINGGVVLAFVGQCKY